MIAEATMKYLIAKKIKDADTLLKNGRYPAAIYMAGYAVEIALKYRICRTLNFIDGFPETVQDMSSLLNNFNRIQSQPISVQLRDIRHHDLNRLLLYSGMEARIISFFPDKWSVVEGWNPANRYKKVRVMGKTATSYVTAVKTLVKEFV